MPNIYLLSLQVPVSTLDMVIVLAAAVNIYVINDIKIIDPFSFKYILCFYPPKVRVFALIIS